MNGKHEPNANGRVYPPNLLQQLAKTPGSLRKKGETPSVMPADCFEVLHDTITLTPKGVAFLKEHGFDLNQLPKPHVYLED